MSTGVRAEAEKFFSENGHVQLSREQASHFFDIEAWRLMSQAERCGFQVNQACLTMPFGTLKNDFEQVLGEKMADVAFERPYFLARSLKAMGHAAPDVEEIISRIPEERLGPLADLAGRASPGP